MNQAERILDSDQVTGCKADISFDNGFNFGPVTRSMAAVLAVFGALALWSGGVGYFLGSLFLFPSLFALFSKFGTDICLSNNYVREYASWLGIKRGKWVPTVMLTDIAILRLGKKRSVVHYTTAIAGSELRNISTETDISANEVFLLSANHRKRILVKTCKSKKEAEEFAADLAQKMGKNFVPFNPQISEKTKARR